MPYVFGFTEHLNAAQSKILDERQLSTQT